MRILRKTFEFTLAHIKVCNEMKLTIKKKLCMCKNVIYGRKHFIRRIQKTDEDNLHKLRVNNYGHNESIVCLVNR